MKAWWAWLVVPTVGVALLGAAACGRGDQTTRTPDLTKPGAPARWTYKPRVEQAARGVACCDVVNRGAVIADERLFFNTLDNHTIALDANTGAGLWDTKLGEINLTERDARDIAAYLYTLRSN